MATATFENALKKLEESVSRLEEGSLTLEDALSTFEQGIRWSRECNKFLEKAEQRIEVILKDEKEDFKTSSFDLE